MYSIRLQGDTAALLRKMRRYSELDRKGLNIALAEGVRESTLERFKQGRGPDGKRWKTSIRAAETGGKTLIDSSQLRNSIKTTADASGFAVGTTSFNPKTTILCGLKSRSGRGWAFKSGRSSCPRA